MLPTESGDYIRSAFVEILWVFQYFLSLVIYPPNSRKAVQSPVYLIHSPNTIEPENGARGFPTFHTTLLSLQRSKEKTSLVLNTRMVEEYNVTLFILVSHTHSTRKSSFIISHYKEFIGNGYMYGLLVSGRVPTKMGV
jgi:hypothetical protein